MNRISEPLDSSPLRVLLVTARYFPYMGGIETHVYELAKRMAQQGVDTTILTTDAEGQSPLHEQRDGVQIRRVRAFPSHRDLYIAPDIYSFIKQGDWDIVHCQGVHTFVPPFAMLACQQAELPYVVTFHTGGHSSRLRTALRGVQWRTLRPLLARANHFVAVSTFEQEYFSKRLNLSPDRFTFIPNGSDLPRPENPAPIHKDAPLIISAGRLERFKGHQRVVSAMPRVLERFPNARLMILGSGSYESELRQLVQLTGVAHRVEFKKIPAQDRQGMANMLASASLVTLLSQAESNPVFVMEALALGRPTLVADTSGLSELAARGLARAIPLESSSEEIADAMLEQLRNPLIPVQVELPTWETCTRDVLDVYTRVTHKPLFARAG